MKSLILLTLFCLCTIQLSAQSKKGIDSLHLALFARNKPLSFDTTLVSIYCELGKEFIKLKSDSAIYYLQKALNLSKTNNYKFGLLKTYINL